MKYLDFMIEFLAHYYGAILLVGSSVAGILLAILADKGNTAIVKGDNTAIVKGDNIAIVKGDNITIKQSVKKESLLAGKLRQGPARTSKLIMKNNGRDGRKRKQDTARPHAPDDKN